MRKEIVTAEEFFEKSGTYPELAIKFAQLHVEKFAEINKIDKELVNLYKKSIT